MEQTLTMASFLEMRQPFSFFHKIFFKNGTPAADCYGSSVYGRFRDIPKGKKGADIIAKDNRFKIDAPKINGNNSSLPAELKSSLYYKGVLFEDIDLALSYPESLS